METIDSPTPTPTPKRKTPVLALVIGAVCILALAVAAIAAFSGGDDETTNSADPVASCEDGEWQPGTRNQCVNGEWVAQESDAPTTTERQRQTTTTTEPEPVFPTAADYSLTLITESKQCFGSAGCNLTLKTELAIIGQAAADYDDPVSITYQIDGLEDGPVIGTLDIANGQYIPETEVVQTTSQGVEPTIVITAVR